MTSGSHRDPTSGLRIQSLSGSMLTEHVESLAAVRIEVFRAWPYLYEGSLEYERRYLETYRKSPRSLVILVWDGKRCVGASTAIPLSEAGTETRLPFLAGQHDIASIEYFGESILLPAYRGRGLGVLFFEMREAHASAHHMRTCAFCAVDRPLDHPARPREFIPNDGFWSRRGYAKEPAIRAQFDWQDLGDSVVTKKTMTFWTKSLREAF